MNRYSAKLLFQFRPVPGNGKSYTMLRCEERLIVVNARNAGSALRKAKAHGKESELELTAEAGNPILFEFVGVTDLLKLDTASHPDEVWYDIKFMKSPMERKNKLIPPEEKLNAIWWERYSKRRKPTAADRPR